MPKVALSYNSGFLIILLISRLMTIIGVKQRLCTNNLPSELFSLDIANKLSFDDPSISMASVDFGMLVHAKPAAIFRPTSVHDIVSLLKFSYNSSIPFKIAARGRGHSCRGQAMVENGVVIDMTSLKSFLNNNINNNNNYDDNNNNNIINTNDNDNNFDNNNNIDNDSNFNNNNNNNNNFNNGGIRVSYDATLGYYVDVGGGQLWIDVLQSTLEHGVAPVAWTDYLYLSVGGTLSNAGISGQAFRYGPQISNVYELDVVTGKGELITCSKKKNQELFYAALGGLGQFGIITRARIKLEVAPKRVKWVRMLYDNFETFTKDQEHLISSYGYEQEETLSGGKFDGLNYVEGSLMHQFSPNNWRSSFFTPTDQTKITSLNTTNGILYCLEVAKYYYEDTNNVDIDKELERKLQGLDLIQGFMFQKEVSFVEFLNRVRKGEMELQSTGQWDVPHPWLNIFVPRSQINHLAQVFTNVATKNSKVLGPILIYPLNKNKWDDNMSAATPEEDVFYTIGVLHSSGFDDWQALEDKNKELLNYCDEHGIKIKQYLPHYSTTQEWRAHFGSKWGKFKDRKALFDPKMILSPGQKVFASM